MSKIKDNIRYIDDSVPVGLMYVGIDEAIRNLQEAKKIALERGAKPDSIDLDSYSEYHSTYYRVEFSRPETEAERIKREAYEEEREALERTYLEQQAKRMGYTLVKK